jgi:hypothetical protein
MYRRTYAFAALLLLTLTGSTAASVIPRTFDPFGWLRLQPVQVIELPEEFIPANLTPRYSDVYLEYCALPADSEASYVLTHTGDLIQGDPDSCPHELTPEVIFGPQ